jgi:hypothetical protein
MKLFYSNFVSNQKSTQKTKHDFMSKFFKNIVCLSVLFVFLQSCSSSEKSSYPTSESMESTESANNQDESKKEDYSEGQSEETNEVAASKPLNQLVIPEQEFTIEKIIIPKENSSENEQLSVSNKHAKVLLFAKKLQKGSYPIAKNNLPYATVHVMLTQGQEKIEGDLEDGTVKLLLLDSAGVTKGSFEGTLIKDNERYFIGGNFSN